MSEWPLENKKRTYWAGALVLVPIVLFYATAIKYSLNIPWFDDIENIPYFLLNWLNATSFSEQLGALFRPNNEHRVVAARLVVLLQQAFTGTINFRILAFIGNLSVLGIFGLLVWNFRKVNRQIIWVLPAALLIFNLQFYAMTFMTIMSLQYQMVIFLSFLSLYFLSRGNQGGFWLAILIAWLDTFSMGNGMMVWPSGVVVLAFERRWVPLAGWTLLGATAIFFYFYGYDFVQGNDKGFAYILSHPVKVFVGLLAMIGGIFDLFPTSPFSRRMLLPTLMGGVMLGFLLFWLVIVMRHSKAWGERISFQLPARMANLRSGFGESANAFWLGALFYLFISMALVVFFRTRFDYELVLWSTYKIYPGTFAAICYLLLITILPLSYKKMAGVGVLVLALCAWGASYYYYVPEVAQIKHVREAFAFNQRHDGIGLGASKGTAFEPMVVGTLQGVEEKQVYQLPVPLVHPSEEGLFEMATTGTLSVAIQETEETVRVEVPNATAGQPLTQYVVLRSPQNLYLFYVSPTTRVAHCPKATLRSGTYQTEIWEVTSGANPTQNRLLATNQSITIR